MTIQFDTPFGAPDFGAIASSDFLPAITSGMARHLAEIDAIAANPAEPTFANTIDAFELSGDEMNRAAAIFWNLSSSDSTEELRSIERELGPLQAAHQTKILMNAALFARIDDIFSRRHSLGLGAEQLQVLGKIHRHFVTSGARLQGPARDRVGEIRRRLATLGTLFGQNVLKDETDWIMVLGADDLEGLPAFFVSEAQGEAKSRGVDGYVVTLLRSSVEPFLAFSARRDLRENAFNAWIGRGDRGSTDNKPIIRETLALRAELARLLGFPDYAAYKFSETMAKTVDNAEQLLHQVWVAGKARAARERDDLLRLAAADGLNAIAAWDWRYYAEKVRRSAHAFDEAAIKPYFQLENIIEASFDCASRLFGLQFEPAPYAPVYHADVRAFEVKDAAGQHLALFYGDYFARPGKRSGAWMSTYRDQKNLGGSVRPIVVNVMNFSKPPEGEPALLSFDDARTLFHEFGHALHGMLSDVTYPSLAGTNVPRDFVELPSQLYEHWLEQPEVLAKHALHAGTGEPMPKALLEKLVATRTFGQGHATVEYCASALVDLAFHKLADPGDIDVAAFEVRTLENLGMPPEIAMRHRTPHFQHVFAGDGYSAGYYSYLWSEVLDADAFEAFRESGNIFNGATADRLATFIYSAGHSREPDEAYILFRGRLPSVDALLAKRGLQKAA